MLKLCGGGGGGGDGEVVEELVSLGELVHEGKNASVVVTRLIDGLGLELAEL